ncbi:MAG: chromate transporter [Clostridiaceae bacterium]|nr:chromate transporter [Eubacteriales bacterium]
MFLEYLALFWSFFKVGAVGVGGGYAMLSMIVKESANFNVTLSQFADLNALDMIVPGPIAINAATYVGYLDAGIVGALAATLGVVLPSFAFVTLVMRFLARYKESDIAAGILLGVKPVAVGLIAAAAVTIAAAVALVPEATLASFFAAPLASVLWFPLAVFALVALLNIRFKVNPILLTFAAGAVGAILSWAGVL